MRKLAAGLLVCFILLTAGGIYALLTIGSPYVCDWLCVRAARAAAAGSDRRAEALYRRALALEPDDSDARIALARFYADRARFSAGEALLEAGIARFPGGTPLYLALSALYLREGQIDRAVQLLDRAADSYAALALSARRPPVRALPRSGSYTGPIDFTLQTEPGVGYLYQLRGCWEAYTGAVRLTEGSPTVRVVAINADGIPSRIMTWRYTLRAAVPALSAPDLLRCPFCGETFRAPADAR